MKGLKLREIGKREMLVVGFALALIAVIGTNITFVAIQNQPTVLDLDYYVTVLNSDGTVYAWTKGEGIPAEFDAATLSGFIGCGVVFTSANVPILSVSLEIDGPTPSSYDLVQSEETPEAWGTTIDTTQLADGDYTFTFSATVDTTVLHPSGEIGGEETAPLSAFGVNFLEGKGNPGALGDIPMEVIIIVALIGGLLLFTGNKVRGA